MADKRRDNGPREPAVPPGEGRRVPPPLVSAPTELPFRGMSSTRFERLCQDVAKAHGFTHVHRYGKPGQAQHGVDFLGLSPDRQQTAFQVKQTKSISASELAGIVRLFAGGALADRTDVFVICMSVEANDKELQDRLAELHHQYPFPIEIWDAVELTYLLRNEEPLVRKFFGTSWAEAYFGSTALPRQRIDAEALLYGPVEALKLGPKVEEARQLVVSSPATAAGLYEEIADALRERFPGHAERFQQLRATALKEAGDAAASHDVLMELAIRDLFERAKPQLSSGVARGLREVQDGVDEVRQARGAAMILFGRWHEDPHALTGLARVLRSLGDRRSLRPLHRGAPVRGRARRSRIRTRTRSG